jgi:hypothetical protein
MKVRWTTITKDESTWPPRELPFLLSSTQNKTCMQRSWNSMALSPQTIYTIYGLQWRPMPKPRKKNKEPISAEGYIEMVSGVNTPNNAPRTIAGRMFMAEKILRMSEEVKTEEIVEIMNIALKVRNELFKLDELLVQLNKYKLFGKESPWKSAKESPPKNRGKFLTRVKITDGIYSYAISLISDKYNWFHNPFNKNDFCCSRDNQPDEWMEIPE